MKAFVIKYKYDNVAHKVILLPMSQIYSHVAGFWYIVEDEGAFINTLIEHSEMIYKVFDDVIMLTATGYNSDLKYIKYIIGNADGLYHFTRNSRDNIARVTALMTRETFDKFKVKHKKVISRFTIRE